MTRNMHFSSFARLTFGCGALLTAALSHTAHAAVYSGGSVGEGIDAAIGLTGISGETDLRSFIVNLTEQIASYVTIAGILAITIAGFYLLLGFGSESAKDTAKRIIIYTLIGILVVLLAEAIVNLFVGLGEGNISAEIPNRVCSILVNALGYVAFIGTLAIVVAGFYLLLGFGSEDAKGTAQRIIIYTIAGILIIAFATAIVGLAFSLAGDSGPASTFTCSVGGASGGSTDFREVILNLLDVALGLLALLAVVAIVIAGFMMVLSLGSEDTRNRAVRIILYTIAGLLVIFFARTIIGFFLNLGSNI